MIAGGTSQFIWTLLSTEQGRSWSFSRTQIDKKWKMVILARIYVIQTKNINFVVVRIRVWVWIWIIFEHGPSANFSFRAVEPVIVLRFSWVNVFVGSSSRNRSSFRPFSDAARNAWNFGSYRFKSKPVDAPGSSCIRPLFSWFWPGTPRFIILCNPKYVRKRSVNPDFDLWYRSDLSDLKYKDLHRNSF